MFCLYDTFNNRIISRHRSVRAVVRAAETLDRTMQNGSYLPTTIKKITSGEPVETTDEIKEQYLCERYEFSFSPLSSIK